MWILVHWILWNGHLQVTGINNFFLKSVFFSFLPFSSFSVLLLAKLALSSTVNLFSIGFLSHRGVSFRYLMFICWESVLFSVSHNCCFYKRIYNISISLVKSFNCSNIYSFSCFISPFSYRFRFRWLFFVILYSARFCFQYYLQFHHLILFLPLKSHCSLVRSSLQVDFLSKLFSFVVN